MYFQKSFLFTFEKMCKICKSFKMPNLRKSKFAIWFYWKLLSSLWSKFHIYLHSSFQTTLSNLWRVNQRITLRQFLFTMVRNEFVDNHVLGNKKHKDTIFMRKQITAPYFVYAKWNLFFVHVPLGSPPWQKILMAIIWHFIVQNGTQFAKSVQHVCIVLQNTVFHLPFKILQVFRLVITQEMQIVCQFSSVI